MSIARQQEHKQPYGWHTLEASAPFDIPAPTIPKATHNNLVATLTLTTHMPDHLPLLLYFARHSAHCMSLPTSDPIHLPIDTKKYYVIKGPFVHAKTKEVFEEKKFSGVVQIFDGNLDAVKDWTDYVTRSMPSGVNVALETYAWETVAGSPGAAAAGTAPESGAKAQPATMTFEDKVKAKAAEFLEVWSKPAPPPAPKKAPKQKKAKK
ncbi:mitochondrial 37S ribosomal protein rsm10 [Geranomyces variabilis]|nr:mitochondrial 37S ribosomal protein rsm10 [Geranomyces variabilis]